MIGDFDLSEDDDSLDQFMQELNLENVVKVPTCVKSDSLTCIDLILTSDKKKLANIRAVETGLSDFHAMVVTTLKGIFHKGQFKIYHMTWPVEKKSFRKKICLPRMKLLQKN